MPETLLSHSNIWLYGRVMADLNLVPPHDPFIPDLNDIDGGDDEGRGSANTFVENQLLAAGANFARIYGISYEGTYFDLPWPMIFLVHGAGAEAETTPGGGPSRFSRAPDNPDRSGQGAQDFSFADGLRVWSYDRADYSIRLDVESGTFEELLIGLISDGDIGPVSGARVRGARVQGARVSGARVSGARVRGARLRGPKGGDDFGD